LGTNWYDDLRQKPDGSFWNDSEAKLRIVIFMRANGGRIDRLEP
jgi:hypothetical protein